MILLYTYVSYSRLIMNNYRGQSYALLLYFTARSINLGLLCYCALMLIGDINLKVLHTPAVVVPAGIPVGIPEQYIFRSIPTSSSYCFVLCFAFNSILYL